MKIIKQTVNHDGWATFRYRSAHFQAQINSLRDGYFDSTERNEKPLFLRTTSPRAKFFNKKLAMRIPHYRTKILSTLYNPTCWRDNNSRYNNLLWTSLRQVWHLEEELYSPYYSIFKSFHERCTKFDDSIRVSRHMNGSDRELRTPRKNPNTSKASRRNSTNDIRLHIEKVGARCWITRV